MAKDPEFSPFNPPQKKPIKKVVAPKKTLSTEAIIEKAHALNDHEMVEMVERIQFMQKDLQTQVKNLQEVIPITHANITKFLNDQDNFPPEQWEMIQENRQILEKKLWEMVGKDPQKAKEKRLEEKGTKEMRGKTIGTRRNWIPIR